MTIKPLLRKFSTSVVISFDPTVSSNRILFSTMVSFQRHEAVGSYLSRCLKNAAWSLITQWCATGAHGSAPRRLTSSCPALPRDSSVSLALPLGTSLGGQSLPSHDILLLSTASSGCSVNISEQINPRMKERGMARSGVCVGDERESEPWGSRPSPWGVFRPQSHDVSSKQGTGYHF